jgi:hypothetical protein
MWMIREDSTAVEIHNEGLVVFLYDEANSKAIREARPMILEGFGSEADDALAELTGKGFLVVYERPESGPFKQRPCCPCGSGQPAAEPYGRAKEVDGVLGRITIEAARLILIPFGCYQQLKSDNSPGLGHS